VRTFLLKGSGAVVVSLVMALSACAVQKRQVSTKPPLRVMTTVLPLTLFTRAVAGDCARVSALLPVGADPHVFQARPADVLLLSQADVVVVNGLGLEAFITPLLASAKNPELKLINTSAGIEPLHQIPMGRPNQDHHHQGHAGDGELHDSVDPHIWLDPRLALQQVTTIRDGLIAADPSCAEGYRERAAAFAASLKRLDQDLETQLEPYKGRTVFSVHSFLAYFSRRYGLNTESLVVLPDDQPTPGDLQRMSALIKQERVYGVLKEPGRGRDALNVLAADLTLKRSVFDSLEQVPAGESVVPDLYERVMRRNAQAVIKTLQP
jgi:zinc transport system substrate-binding protein